MGKRVPSDAAVHSRGTRNFEMGGAKSLMMKIFRAQAWHETGMLDKNVLKVIITTIKSMTKRGKLDR